MHHGRLHAIEASHAAANAAYAVRHAPTFGVRTTSVDIDVAAVMERLRRERDSFFASTVKTIDKISGDLRIHFGARSCMSGVAQARDGGLCAIDDGVTCA